jgi:hypothetical protein
MAKAKTTTHGDVSEKLRFAVLHARQHGGFSINRLPGLGSVGESLSAFSTLDEALDWLRVNMAQPAKDAA